MKSPRRFPAVALLLALLLPAGLVRADEATRNLFRKTLHCTVQVRTPFGSGTGWVADRQLRLLVTNHHVVLNEDTVSVVFPLYQDGKLVTEKSAYAKEPGRRAKVIDTDVPRDLAVIQLIDPLPEGVEELKLAADSAEPSDRVHSIGNPGASDALWVYTSGTVRSVVRSRFHHFDEMMRAKFQRSCRVVETQAPINPGDSGGPVVNDQGELVAVVSSFTKHKNGVPVRLMSQCINVSEVRTVLANSRPLLDPQTAAALVSRGNRRWLRRRLDDAFYDFTKALELDRDSATAYLGRGRIHYDKGDYDTAIADYYQSIRLMPENPKAFNNRGLCYQRKGDFDKALADLTRAIQLDPRMALAYNNRGYLYETRKDLRRAIEDYSRAVELNPEMDLAWKNRGNCRYQMKEYKEAFADADKALALNHYQEYAWNIRGWSLHMSKAYDAAADNFSRALKFYPKNALFHISLGDALTWKGERGWETALGLYNKAVQLSPNYAWAYYSRATAYEHFEQSNRASPDFEKAMKLDPSLKDRIKTFQTKFLKVINDTGESLRVYLQYEYLTPDGDWAWWPETAGTEYWDIPAGQTWVLEDAHGWTVRARRVRIWAKSKSSTKRWDRDYSQDVWLSRAPYKGTRQGTFRYAFK